MNHTPGPWRVVEEPTRVDGIIWAIECDRGDDVDGIAEIRDTTNDGTDEELEANAHLIAAAPDLLEACEMYITARDLDLVSLMLDADKAIRAAVAKAKPKGK